MMNSREIVGNALDQRRSDPQTPAAVLFREVTKPGIRKVTSRQFLFGLTDPPRKADSTVVASLVD